MKTFKKIFPMVIVVVLGVAFFWGMTHATQNYFGGASNVNTIGVGGTAGGVQGAGLLSFIKNFINWVLGLLSLIALVMLLYGGFNMVTAAGDESKYKKGFKILEQAAIGLAIIGLSWLIVSAIFWLIGAGTANPSTQAPTGAPQ